MVRANFTMFRKSSSTVAADNFDEQDCILVATAQSHGRDVAQRSYEAATLPRKSARAYHLMSKFRQKQHDPQ